MPIKLGLNAPWVFGVGGFPRVCRSLALDLADMGVEIRLLNTTPKDVPFLLKEDVGRLTGFTQQTWTPEIWLSLNPFCSFLQNVRGWNIGMSMWESPTIPSFGRMCRGVDEVWVPSIFNWNTFRSAIPVPPHKLAYMPLAVNTDIFSPSASKIKITGGAKDYDFVYGCLCGYSARKGVDLVLAAHFELFDSIDNVALFIKGDGYGEKKLPLDIVELKTGHLVDGLNISKDEKKIVQAAVNNHNPTVLHSFDSFNDSYLASIYRSLNLFVLPSRGEGFGLPPLEAMSCEVPVIGTKATGMEEYMLEEISYPVRSNGWKADPRCDWITKFYSGVLFADPDYAQYRDLVWYVYTHRDEAKEKGKKAREFVVDTYDTKVVISRLKRRLEEIVGGKKTTENFWPEDM